MSELLDKWLAHYDSIHRGWTPRGIANGLCATNGFCFPRMAGGYNLYRGTPGLEDVDTNIPVGAAGAKATQIQTFSWRPHAASTGYVFVLRSIGGGGVESASSDEAPSRPQVVSVPFDEAGLPEGLKPNPPTALCVARAADGRFAVSWDYVPRDEETPPAQFKVFTDNGTGVMDYDTPIGTVPYRPRAGRFEFVTETHAHGAVRTFGVRSVSTDGSTDGNTATVTSWADAEGPPVHTAVQVEVIDVG